jgi:transcriptional regulator with XRE-family HTH domain
VPQDGDISAVVTNAAQDIGSFIRTQRESAQVSVRQLAERAGVSNPYLSQIERGLRKPSAEVLKASFAAGAIGEPRGFGASSTRINDVLRLCRHPSVRVIDFCQLLVLNRTEFDRYAAAVPAAPHAARHPTP